LLRGVRKKETTMAGRDIPTVDQYWETLAPLLKSFSPEEQDASVTLYRELANGRAVDGEQFARALGTTPAAALALLQRDAIKRFVYPDAEGRVLGFGGLAAAPMHHRFEVNGRALWTWCAWDSLFIPEILGRPARVSSPDPESRELVRLTVSPERIESVEPGDAVISFIRPDAEAFGISAANVMAKFCHYIFFFASRPSGERWTTKHPGTFLYRLDDAFALAKRLNAANFGSALGTPMAVDHQT
jgi:alkylmercury lyase